MKLEHAKEILQFMESIEGSGYGGMADYEIAREQMRVAVREQEAIVRSALKVLCFTRVKVKDRDQEFAGNMSVVSAQIIMAELARAGLEIVVRDAVGGVAK